jgi:hypothetical protein
MAGEQVWLSIADMAWHPAPAGRVSGRGRALVTSPKSQPRHRRGTLEVVLTSVGGAYRIHSLHFQED